MKGVVSMKDLIKGFISFAMAGTALAIGANVGNRLWDKIEDKLDERTIKKHTKY